MIFFNNLHLLLTDFLNNFALPYALKKKNLYACIALLFLFEHLRMSANLVLQKLTPLRTKIIGNKYFFFPMNVINRW